MWQFHPSVPCGNINHWRKMRWGVKVQYSARRGDCSMHRPPRGGKGSYNQGVLVCLQPPRFWEFLESLHTHWIHFLRSALFPRAAQKTFAYLVYFKTPHQDTITQFSHSRDTQKVYPWSQRMPNPLADAWNHHDRDTKCKNTVNESQRRHIIWFPCEKKPSQTKLCP